VGGFDVVEPGAVGVDQAAGERVVEHEGPGAVGDRVGSLVVNVNERF
jgi:hypothetical protein